MISIIFSVVATFVCLGIFLAVTFACLILHMGLSRIHADDP